MKQQSKVIPAVTINYHRRAPGSASGFSYEIDGVALSPLEVGIKLGLSANDKARLKAEAFDLTWPLASGLCGVTVKHELGEYKTDCNAQSGRLGIVNYFYGSTLGIVTGRAGEDEDGTPAKVIGLSINCPEGFAA